MSVHDASTSLTVEDVEALQKILNKYGFNEEEFSGRVYTVWGLDGSSHSCLIVMRQFMLSAQGQWPRRYDYPITPVVLECFERDLAEGNLLPPKLTRY